MPEIVSKEAIIRQPLLAIAKQEGEDIVHAGRNIGTTCVRQFGPYLMQA